MTCGRVLSWRIGPFLLTNGGCGHCSFRFISSICWAYFSDIMVLPGFKNCSGSDQQQITMSIFWCKFDFGKGFEASSQSSRLSGFHWFLYKIHFSSHVTVRSRMVPRCCLEEKMALQNDSFFNFQSTHEAPTYWPFSPFQFALNAKLP